MEKNGDVKSPYKEQEKKTRESKCTRIPCLKCDKFFWSHDVKRNRLCRKCNDENSRQWDPRSTSMKKSLRKAGNARTNY